MVGSRVIGVNVRAGAAALALAVFVAPASSKEKPPRPPLDIRPQTVARAKPGARPQAVTDVPIPRPRPASVPVEPAGLELASASSRPFPAVADLRGAEAIVPRTRWRLTPAQEASRAELNAMIARHAEANGIPEALVHRVVVRESRYQAHLIGSCGCYGLMQIKHGTARALGYEGTARGLLDAETNLTYGVKYLAGAYRKAHGNADRAIGYYARGYSTR
jgi:soluble lytic murein transglycosylase-like protein